MRARQFILREYSREKTVNVFGNKLVAALGKDKSHTLSGTQLGTDRAFIDQKIKVNDVITAEQRQIIIDHIMVVIENSDPTANKEYVQWLTKVYANQGIKLEDIISRGNSALKMYHEFKVKKILPAEYRDIGRIDFAGLEAIAQNLDLRNALAAKEEQEAAKTVDKGEAETVFENAAVRIIVPKNEAASCYYGQGTRWCTAGRDNNMYDRYASDGDLYILLPKQPDYEGEKYQLHFSSNQFMDEGDNYVDSVKDLITKRFGNLLPFFMEREPSLKDWLVFTPDEVLEPLLAKIKTAVNDHVSEIVNDWEVQDDYWWDYLRKEGYVYPEGHEEEGEIDFDAAADADLSYTDWNYEASDFIRTINNAVDLTPEEVREIAQEEEDDYNGDVGVNDLDTIIERSISKNIGRNSSDGGVIEWIRDHIYIKKTGGDGAWDVSLLYTDKEGKRVEYAIH
jgi:hypothetical protein